MAATAGPYPVRFRTAAQLRAAGLPTCECGHEAALHGLLVQHVGGSGCFRTFWKATALTAHAFDRACECRTYRPDGPLPADVTTLPGVIVPAGAERDRPPHVERTD